MKIVTLLLTLLLAAMTGDAGDVRDQPQLRAVLDQLGVQADPHTLLPAPIPGFLEVLRGTQVLYVSTDGALLIDGEILSVASETNLTENRRAAVRRELLAGIPEAARIVVPATGPTRATISVFVDTNCPYCLVLHRQQQALSQDGIEIQYLFYPRSGPSGESYAQAVAVWCSRDRNTALRRALTGETLPAADCRNPVASHYALAKRLELKGTPAIVSEFGAVNYGIRSAQQVLDAVEPPG